jgi:hypothetical protein
MLTDRVGVGAVLRAALMGLPSKLKVIYVMNADADGTLVTPGPNELVDLDPALTGEKGWRKASDWCV